MIAEKLDIFLSLLRTGQMKLCKFIWALYIILLTGYDKYD